MNRGSVEICGQMKFLCVNRLWSLLGSVVLCVGKLVEQREGQNGFAITSHSKAQLLCGLKCATHSQHKWFAAGALLHLTCKQMHANAATRSHSRCSLSCSITIAQLSDRNEQTQAHHLDVWPPRPDRRLSVPFPYLALAVVATSPSTHHPLVWRTRPPSSPHTPCPSEPAHRSHPRSCSAYLRHHSQGAALQQECMWFAGRAVCLFLLPCGGWWSARVSGRRFCEAHRLTGRVGGG